MSNDLARITKMTLKDGKIKTFHLKRLKYVEFPLISQGLGDNKLNVKCLLIKFFSDSYKNFQLYKIGC